MKNRKKMEKWLQDENFSQYVSQRCFAEIKKRFDAGLCDPLFDEMDEGFETNDAYAEPMAEYLLYRLHTARLCKNRQRRERGLWLVYFNLAMLGHYIKWEEFDKVIDELDKCLMTVLHREYTEQLNRQKK